MDRQAYKIVRLTWQDPTSIDAWDSIDDVLAYDAHTIVTVGQLIGETENYFITAQNVDVSGGEVSCTMIIPKKCLIKPIEVICDQP
jgi:hypothetical protein